MDKYELGYTLDHTTGSHRIYIKENSLEVVIPVHSNKDIPVGIIIDCYRRAGLNRDEFLDVLRKFL